jgi:hypothetical protein
MKALQIKTYKYRQGLTQRTINGFKWISLLDRKYYNLITKPFNSKQKGETAQALLGYRKWKETIPLILATQTNQINCKIIIFKPIRNLKIQRNLNKLGRERALHKVKRLQLLIPRLSDKNKDKCTTCGFKEE